MDGDSEKGSTQEYDSDSAGPYPAEHPLIQRNLCVARSQHILNRRQHGRLSFPLKCALISTYLVVFICVLSCRMCFAITTPSSRPPNDSSQQELRLAFTIDQLRLPNNNLNQEYSFDLSVSPLHLSNENTQRGLSFTISAGMLIPSNAHAAFYRGTETDPNSIYRVLHSEAYGERIWSELKDANLISSAIINYRQLRIVEYGDVYYKNTTQFGIGIRYDYTRNWGWILRFDYAKLRAVGAFLISADNETGILSNKNQYVSCPNSGLEERIVIDLGLCKHLRLPSGFDLDIELGGSLNNTKVKEHNIQVAGTTYSILDVWNGQSPSSYTVPYEYINQGGFGYGLFATVSSGYTFNNLSTVTVGYTLYRSYINLQQYASSAFTHLIFIRVDINRFLFQSL